MSRKKVLKEIGKKIKKARLEKNLSCKGIAEKTNTSSSVISRFETGLTEMKVYSFLKICNELEINIGDLNVL